MQDSRNRTLTVVGAVFFLALGVLWAGWLARGVLGPRPEPPPVVGTVPEFSLTERSGRTVTRQDLLGNFWLADFVFTRCRGPCPLLTARMSRLQTELAELRELKFLSISVDPLADTPEVLRAYADKHHADPERWWFLTGAPEAVVDFVTKGFKLPLFTNEKPEAMKAGDLVTHSTRFVLIDREGQIRRYLESEDPNVGNRVRADIKSFGPRQVRSAK